MTTVSSRMVSVRIPLHLAQWLERYGKERRWSRSTVIVAALESFREDAEGGVPERTRVENLRETERGEVVRADPRKPASFELPPSSRPMTDAMVRQMKLNEAKARKR